jgi:hypothetical protein
MYENLRSFFSVLTTRYWTSWSFGIVMMSVPKGWGAGVSIPAAPVLSGEFGQRRSNAADFQPKATCSIILAA